MASESTTPWTRLLRQPLIVVGILAVAGLGCGWLWHHLWAPAPTGVGFKGKMYFPDDTIFRATGLYVLIALAAGVLLGAVLTYVFEYDEVATLIAVTLGALLAGALMAWVGSVLGPDSPQPVADALTQEPGEVTGSLSVEPLARWTCFPCGGVVGALFVLVTFNRRTPREPVSTSVRPTVEALRTESTDLT